MKLVFFFLVCGLALFFLLYKDNLSLVILMSVIILPIFSYIALILESRRVSIVSSSQGESAPKGEAAEIFFTVRNNGFLPVSAAKLVLCVKKEPSGNSEIRNVTIPLPSHSHETVTVKLCSNYCGRIVCTVKEMRIYDVLSLSSMKLKRGVDIGITVDFLPKGNIPLDSGSSSSLSVRESISGEASFSSSNKNADDYDELRDYRDGDKLNKVAWKLCGKTGDPDSVIVRDSDKGREAVFLLIADVYSAENEKSLDRIYELFYAAADTMCGHEIAFDCVKSDNTILENISLTDKFSECVISAYGDNAGMDEIILNPKNKRYDKIVLVTADRNTSAADKLRLAYGARETIIIFSEQGN